MPIYTKTGDKGETGLFSGIRVSKASPRIEAIGTVDELNAIIGTTIAQVQNSKFAPPAKPLATHGKIQNYNSKVKNELLEIQKDLFEIGAALANPNQKIDLSKRVKEFENLIDKMTKELPPLFNFILPGGGKAGAMLHLARTVCRRTERKIVELSEKEKVKSDVTIYINRLSDLFLTMSRFINHLEKKEEIIWSSES